MTKRQKQQHRRTRPGTGAKRDAPQRAREAPRAQRLRAESKLRACLNLLNRSEGATLQDLQTATGWQPHSVRGFLSGTVKKKLQLDVASIKEARGRVYRVTSAGGDG